MQTPNQLKPIKDSGRSTRVGLFWPVVLIALGVIFLLSNFRVLPGNVWDWILNLWPVILIAWGLDEMFKGEYVGAALLVGLGGLFLIANFGYILLNPWEVIVQLWPIFIISAGLSLLFNRRWVGTAGSLVGAVLILLVLAGSILLVRGGTLLGQQGLPIPGQNVSQALNGATRANVTIEPVAGSLHLKALSESTALIAGTVNLHGSQTLLQNSNVEGGTANYRLKGEGEYIGINPAGANWYNWDLALNPDVPMTLRVNMGAGQAVLDLSDIHLTDLDVNMAAGTTTITLPRGERITASVNGAVGSTTIFVPPGAGVRVAFSDGLTASDMPSGYAHSGDTYTSPGYDTAAARIDLRISQALGAVSVREQTGR